MASGSFDLYCLAMAVFTLAVSSSAVASTRTYARGELTHIPRRSSHVWGAEHAAPNSGLITADTSHHFQIGHWVIVWNGRYAGRRAMIVGRTGRKLRLHVNGGPRGSVKLKIADVRRETTARYAMHRQPRC